MGEIVRGCVDRKKVKFFGVAEGRFPAPSAAPEPIAPKFLHTTFPSKYFVLAEFHPRRLSFGGVMPPTPSGASLHYGLPYSIWQAINSEQLHDSYLSVRPSEWLHAALVRLIQVRKTESMQWFSSFYFRTLSVM